MNIKSQILDAIDDINIITAECEYNTICEMYNSYDKASLILEYYEGEDVDAFNVFQESSVSDKMKKSGAKYNTLMKILTFIPRLIKALFQTISEKLKKTKLSKELQRAPKETKEAFVEIFDKKKDKKKRKTVILKVLGVAGVVGGAVAGVRHIAKTTIYKKSDKIISRIDNEMHSLMESNGDYHDSNYLRDFADKLGEYRNLALGISNPSRKGKYLERARMMVNLSHDLERIIKDYTSDSTYNKERENVANLKEYKDESFKKIQDIKNTYSLSIDTALNATISEMHEYYLTNLHDVTPDIFVKFVDKYNKVLEHKIRTIDKNVQKELSDIIEYTKKLNSDSVTSLVTSRVRECRVYMSRHSSIVMDEYDDITKSFDEWYNYATTILNSDDIDKKLNRLERFGRMMENERRTEQSTQQTKQHDSRIPDPSSGGKILLNNKEKTPEEIEKYYEEAERFLEEYDKKHEALKKHLKQHILQSNVYDDIKFSIGFDESKNEIVYNIIPFHNITSKINLILSGITNLSRNAQNIGKMTDKDRDNLFKAYTSPNGDYNMEHISKLASGTSAVGINSQSHSSNPLKDSNPINPEQIMKGIDNDSRSIKKLIETYYEPAIKDIAEVGEDVFPQIIIKWLNDAKNEITQLRNLFQEYTDFVVGVVNDVNKIYASIGVEQIPVKGDNK